eukprot:1032042-Prymnesium_polylepis.1
MTIYGEGTCEMIATIRRQSLQHLEDNSLAASYSYEVHQAPSFTRGTSQSSRFSRGALPPSGSTSPLPPSSGASAFSYVDARLPTLVHCSVSEANLGRGNRSERLERRLTALRQCPRPSTRVLQQAEKAIRNMHVNNWATARRITLKIPLTAVQRQALRE